MRIILGADHAGFELKNKIKDYLRSDHDVVDVGADCLDLSDDFSSFVVKMRETFDTNSQDRIIAVCGSGVGMNIGLNKHKGIRCVLGHSKEEVSLAREHNDVNALALSGRISLDLAQSMIDAFLSTPSLSGKYARRMQEIELK